MQAWLRTIFEAPDELMLEAGAVGEVLVARIRLVVVMLIAIMPLIAWASGTRIEEVLTGLTIGTAALIFSFLLLHRVRREGSKVRWRFVSAAFDVTSVSLVLALFLAQGLPHVAVNSRVVWELYLISIAATALRADSRVCLFAGGLALVQYGGIVYGATRYGDLNGPEWAPFLYGTMSWGDQVSRLILIAAATLLALTAVHQTRKLLKLSSQDRLTDIRNRAWLDSRLERELSEADLNQRVLSLAMVDVDAFKPFNDQHGHLAGDEALRTIAQRLNERVSDQGFVARYGGEEFTLVFPGLDLAEAHEVCEPIRAAFEQDRITLPTSNQTVDSPTLSLGLAQFRPGEKPETLIDRADQALIKAKQTGKNKIQSAR